MRLLSSLLVGAVTLAAQGPPPPPQPTVATWTVAYVDVMPSSTAKAVSVLKRYRESSSKEAGFVRIELFEEMDRPGRMNIIENWASPKALTAHQQATSTREMHRQLDAIRMTNFDQRPYKPIVVGPPNPALTPAAYDQAFHVITHVDIGAQGTDTAIVLTRLAQASRKDEGNLRFDVLQHAERDNHFTVIEAWSSRKAWEAHVAARHTRQYRDTLAAVFGSPLEERLYSATK